MVKSELLELISHGESSGVEFKRDDIRPEQLAKEVVALANFQGGRVLLGVEDDGTITGLTRKDTERWVMDVVFGRDWTRSVEVEVVAYSDRLEITSPGALQNSMTIEKMLAGQRSPRNPLLVDIMRDYGYVDARGMGVRRKIVPLVREHSGEDARFEATDDYVRVIMPKGVREP